MITYVKRKHLNEAKYNACVDISYTSRVYGYSWYLDIVADYWDALVLDDYKAVLPVFYNKKWGVKYSFQPYFCQQLNIYTNLKLENLLIKKFYKKIPKSILLFDVNYSFFIEGTTLKNKYNFSLELNKDYKNLFNNYRKDRKKSLQKATKANLTYKNFNDKKALIVLFKEVFSFLNHPEKYYLKIDNIITYCIKNNLGFIRTISLNDELICAGFFVKHKSRIYYLFGASNKKGKKYGATTFLIDSVIKEYSKTNNILDFEGSTIPTIANFYKSFGSKKTIYFNLKTNVFKRIFL